MQKINEVWTRYNKELDKVDVTNVREAVKTGYLERTMSGIHGVARSEINLLNIDLNGKKVLEIGAGYGDYAKQLSEKFNVKNYTIVDTKSMLRFSKAYLKEHKIPCTFIDTEERLPDDNYDILISNICISEIPRDHAEGMLAEFFKRVNHVAIIDEHMEWLGDLIRKHFDVMEKIPCRECKQPNHFLYRANKLID